MRPFEGYQRKAVVIVPTDEEFKRRCEQREKEEGKEIPDSAVLEMKGMIITGKDDFSLYCVSVTGSYSMFFCVSGVYAPWLDVSGKLFLQMKFEAQECVVFSKVVLHAVAPGTYFAY
jgi:uncharacterized iron-regulated membrane protein